jgi:perosamine synthetase
MSSEPFVPLSVPRVAGNEWVYVKECLDTGWVSSVGSFVDRFEREFAARVGARHAVACTSGTAALHIALLLSDVRDGDEVLVPTLTFIAPANAVTYLGARPVFVDAEPRYLQLDIERLRDFLERGCKKESSGLVNRETGRRIRAVLPVHVVGHPCDLDPLLELAERFELAVVEDATEALGSRYKGRAAGTFGRMGCFSFNGNKIITTGNGGMIVTDDPELARKAKYLTTQAKDDPVEFVHGAIGYNYRLSNVSAAIGVAQLERLDEHLHEKERIALRYTRSLAALSGLALPEEAPWATPNRWLFTIRIDEQAFGMSSRRLMALLTAASIETRPLWQPMHRSPAHPGAKRIGGEVADRLNAECLSLPCSVGLSERDQDRVIEVIVRTRTTSFRAGA